MAQLTDITIRNLKPKAGPKAWEKPDGRGLYVFIGVTGAKSFVMRYRINGKPQKLTLGRWAPPDERSATSPTEVRLGDLMSLATARKLAADVMLQLNRGYDPAAAKRDEAQAKQQAAADTFERIAIEYLSRDGDKLRTKRERERMLRRQAFPALGPIPISQLKKSDIIRLLDKIHDESGPVAADRLLAAIRRVLNWHAEREDDYRPPLLRLKPRKPASEQARDRVLDDRELAAIWKVSGEIPTFGPFVRLLLLTAARRTEVSAMTWSEVKDGAWTLPRERNKVAAQNKGVKDLVRPLSAAARAVLDKQPNIEGCPYVFSCGSKPLTGYSKPKRRFDARVAAVLGTAIPNWTLHDLRRTARTLMSRADVRPHHAERCLGHIIRGVEGVYDRHRYLDEMLAAYEALARQIETIVNPPTDTVVPFRKV